MANIGFVGLGSLGGDIAKRLMDAGHSVTGHNRTKSKGQWLIDAGMTWADTPREAASGADFVFSIVRDNDALRAVTSGEDGIIAGLRSGQVYADLSTVSPLVSREIAEQVRAVDAYMLDCPLSGSKITLAAGKMSIMVGGEKSAFDQIEPILLDIGPTVSYMGPNGHATAIKVAINLTMPVQIIAAAEGVLLAEKYGVDRALAIEVILKSVAASPALGYRLPWVIDEPEEHLFNMEMMQKDVQLALSMGTKLGVPMLTSALSNELLSTARAMGLAEKDFYALFDVLARMSGVE